MNPNTLRVLEVALKWTSTRGTFADLSKVSREHFYENIFSVRKTLQNKSLQKLPSVLSLDAHSREIKKIPRSFQTIISKELKRSRDEDFGTKTLFNGSNDSWWHSSFVTTLRVSQPLSCLCFWKEWNKSKPFYSIFLLPVFGKSLKRSCAQSNSIIL